MAKNQSVVTHSDPIQGLYVIVTVFSAHNVILKFILACVAVVQHTFNVTVYAYVNQFNSFTRSTDI